jgi:GlpG protein
MMVVLSLCVLVYSLQQLLGNAMVMALLHFPQTESVLQMRQLWRWLSPVFLHFSEFHLGFNLLWWWLLGKQIESLQGSRVLLLLLVITGVGSNLAQYLMTGIQFGGLSGVVYALAGYVWWLGLRRPQWGLQLPAGVMLQLVIWLVLGFTGWLSAVIGHMANAAHLSGLLLGWFAAMLMMAFQRVMHVKR